MPGGALSRPSHAHTRVYSSGVELAGSILYFCFVQRRRPKIRSTDRAPVWHQSPAVEVARLGLLAMLAAACGIWSNWRKVRNVRCARSAPRCQTIEGSADELLKRDEPFFLDIGMRMYSAPKIDDKKPPENYPLYNIL